MPKIVIAAKNNFTSEETYLVFFTKKGLNLHIDNNKSSKNAHWFHFLRNILFKSYHIQAFQLSNCHITTIVDKN